ncbi:MAG: hypothetical protein JXR69_01320 [Candidatus Delongbacteria bacterium]|nr:hypothetical protein [Candidatus Delongbacteria bacterium]
MKKIIILTLLTISLSMSYAIELGIILGEPTGVSFRQWHGKSLAMDFQLGWSTRNENFDIHGAYLFHNQTSTRIESRPLTFFYGPGGRLKASGNEFILGFKFPFGLYYKFKSIPFSLSGELAPGLNIGSEMEFDLLGGISFRYIF